MSPKKEENEILELESISPLNNDQISKEFRLRNKEKRITLYHYVVHFLAFIIILPFLTMILLQIKIPDHYSTIVSVVIGFYFARSLFE
tara:strand:- start:385 stop:648 length:264 start_codon:yes stop_codon:yes gene_type:complete